MGAHRAAAPPDPAAVEETATGSRWVVLVLLSAFLLALAIQATILDVVLPSLPAQADADRSERVLIVVGYALALAAVLAAAGALGDRTGRRRVLLFGLAVIGLAALGGAVAERPWQLLAARVGLGIGAAGVLPATLSMLRQVFTDPRERMFAFGVWATVFAAGLALGPSTGGWLVHVYGWRAVFVVYVPVAMAAMLLGRWLLPDFRRPVPGGWDWTGLVFPVLVLSGIGVALRMVEHGVTDAAAWVALVLAAGCLYAWGRTAPRRRHPLLDPRPFARRGVAAATLTILLAGYGMVGMLLTTGQWLRYDQHLPPVAAAARTLPLAGALIVTSLLIPPLVVRVQIRYLLAASLAVLALAAFVPWLGSRGGPLGYGSVWLLLALAGLGAGSATGTATMVLTCGAPPERAGAADTATELGYALGVALGAAMLGGLAVSLSGAADTPRYAGAVTTTGVVAGFILLAAAVLAVALLPREDMPGGRR